MSRRVLLLITDLKIGGTPTVVRELATGMHADPDFQVHVACLDHWGPVADQLKDRGIPVMALNASSSLDIGLPKRLISLIRENNFDTVFSFLVHANAVAAWARRSLPGLRVLQSIQTTQPKPRWHWLVQRFAARAAEKIVVPSRSVAQAGMDWSGIEESKIIIIPNAVDPSLVMPHRLHERKRVGFIGRLDPVKRIDYLLSAMRWLEPEISLDIFGDGPERERLEKKVRSMNLGERVKLHGAIAAPWDALAEIDALVLPSAAEGFGLVLIEAMAAGIPAIGTNVPGIRDVIVHEENGLLAESSDPKSLASEIRRALNDSQLRERIVAGGLAAVKDRYDWTEVYKMYRKLLARHIEEVSL